MVTLLDSLNNNYVVSIFLIAVLLTVSLSGTAYSNTDPVGAGSILRSGVDARALGLGGAFVAIANNYAATYWNPAGITKARSIYLGGMNQDKFGLGLNLNYLSGGIPLTNLPFGNSSPLSSISIPYVNDLAIAGTYNSFSTNVRAADAEGNPIGEITYSESVYMGTIGLSFPVFGSIGITGKNYSFSAPNAGVDGLDASASGIGFDLGLLAEPIENLSVGVAAFDIAGTAIKWKNTPTEPTNIAPCRYSAGLAYDLDMSGLPIPEVIAGNTIFTGQYTFGPNVEDKIRGGIEYNKSVFSLRGGGIYSDTGGLELTAGAGIKVSLISVDVAWIQNNAVSAENTTDTIVISSQLTF